MIWVLFKVQGSNNTMSFNFGLVYLYLLDLTHVAKISFFSGFLCLISQLLQHTSFFCKENVEDGIGDRKGGKKKKRKEDHQNKTETEKQQKYS